MAIRELIRRGYWDEHEEDGNDLGGGSGDQAGDEGGTPVEQEGAAGEGADEATAAEGQGEEGKARTLAEEIAQSLGVGKKPEDTAGEGEAPDGKDDGKVRPVSPVPGEKTAKAEDPYAEPEWLKKASPQTQDRFHELVRWNKEKDQHLERLTNDARGFVQMVRDTGANQEQFLEVLDTATLMFHPEKGNPQQAVEKLYNAAKMIAEAAGLPLPGYDPLEAFPDIKERVDNDDLDRATAEELARIRAREKTQERAREQRNHGQQQQQQQEAAITKAVTDLTTFLADKQANDIDFPAKAKIMMEAAEYAKKNLMPHQWLGYMQTQYDFVSKHAKKEAGKDGHRPVRSTGSGGGSKAPETLQDAIKQSLKL